jgi:hypothetical protein
VNATASVSGGTGYRCQRGAQAMLAPDARAEDRLAHAASAHVDRYRPGPPEIHACADLFGRLRVIRASGQCLSTEIRLKCDAARKLDEARGYNFGHNEPKTAVSTAPESSQVVEENGAGDGDRTRDIELGNPDPHEKPR